MGALNYVGYHGFSWSSTVSSSNGMYLSFGATALYPNYSAYQAYGLQLRCLSE